MPSQHRLGFFPNNHILLRTKTACHTPFFVSWEKITYFRGSHGNSPVMSVLFCPLYFFNNEFNKKNILNTKLNIHCSSNTSLNRKFSAVLYKLSPPFVKMLSAFVASFLNINLFTRTRISARTTVLRLVTFFDAHREPWPLSWNHA